MLSQLLIKNYALIEHLELSLPSGLTIITGETGAGKSILLGAIGLLMGNRADTRALYTPSLKCVIEGVFNLSGHQLENLFEEEELDYDDSCIIRREISPNGKSRAFVNDTPVTLEILKRIAGQLLDIHSQNDALLLGNNEFQLDIVDAFAVSGPLLTRYKTDYYAYKKAEQEYMTLKSEADKASKEHDYDQFLLTELDKAALIAGETEALENEQVLLENAVDIRSRLQNAFQCLDNNEQSALALLKEAVQQLNYIGRLSSSYRLLAERAETVLIELKDIAGEIEDYAAGVEINNEKIEEINERLHLLYQLRKKHQATGISELIDIRDALRTKVERVLHIDSALERAEKKRDQHRLLMEQSAKALSKARQEVTAGLEKEIASKVRELGIPNAVVSIKISQGEISKTGSDMVSFLFSANKGISPQELKSVASGGEFSRLMMVIKYIVAQKRKLPTIIFDEIDTGISGEVAIKMGEMMQQMGSQHQIIAITHLHQIAACGQDHYLVYKDHSSEKSVSRVRKLSREERVKELAQMIGGQNPSEAVLKNARELLSKWV